MRSGRVGQRRHRLHADTPGTVGIGRLRALPWKQLRPSDDERAPTIGFLGHAHPRCFATGALLGADPPAGRRATGHAEAQQGNCFDGRPQARDTTTVSGWTHRRRKRRRRARDVDLKAAIWAVVRRQVPPAKLRVIRLRQRWPEIAGPVLARRTLPVDIRGRTLIVNVENDQWRHELQYLMPAVLVRLAEVDERLTRLDVRRGPVMPPGTEDDRPAAEPPVPAAAWTGLAKEPPHSTFEALMEVKDPELRNQLAETRMLLARRGQDAPDSHSDG